jgi:protein-S-isoprenylcysteine O-methyltransferase Ste14
MDQVAYFLALIVYLLTPPAYLYWLIVHPCIGFWRRLGVNKSYALLWSLILGMAVVLFLFRHQVLAVHYPVLHWHASTGVMLLFVGIVLRYQMERELPKMGLIGLPEMQGDSDPQTLATGGIYGHIRHPRYFQGILLLLGFALITNYLAIYIILLVYIPVIFLVIRLEERELVQRYGDLYREYQRRVPMLFPHLGKLQK